MTTVQQFLALGAAFAIGAVTASALPAVAADAGTGWTAAGGTSNAAFFLNPEKGKVAACRLRPNTSSFAVDCSASASLPSN